MEKTLIVKKLNEHVWAFDDCHNAVCYLVVGKERAMVVDTMNGIVDFLPEIREITDLPIMIVNTHGHGDHVGGNVFFDVPGYLHEADFPLIDVFLKYHPDVSDIIRAKGFDEPGFLRLDVDATIDLGGLTVDTIEIPGHTSGEVCFLLNEDRVLFTGDGINSHLWMQLPHSLSVEEGLENLDKVAPLLHEKASYIAHGHLAAFEDISLFDKLREGMRELVNQKGTELSDNDPEYVWHAGVAKQHVFESIPGLNRVIVYLPEHIHKN